MNAARVHRFPSALLGELGRASDRELADRYHVPPDRIRRACQVRGLVVANHAKRRRHLEQQVQVLDAVRSASAACEASGIAVLLGLPSHVVRRHLRELQADHLVEPLDDRFPRAWIPVFELAPELAEEAS